MSIAAAVSSVLRSIAGPDGKAVDDAGAVRGNGAETTIPNRSGSGTRTALNESDATGAIAVASMATMHTSAMNPRLRSTIRSLPLDSTWTGRDVQHVGTFAQLCRG